MKNMSAKKILFTAAAVCAFAGFAATASAEDNTFTDDNAIVSVTAPDNTWKEAEVSEALLALTNGTDMVTVYHYSNGETLPGVVVAGDNYEKICQTYLSSRDEIFVVTGYAVEEEDFEDVKTACESAEILRTGTKKAVSKTTSSSSTAKTQSASSEYTVEGTSDVFYVNGDSLNVRASYSTDSSILGTLDYGDAVVVTGQVKYNGEYTEWLQIQYNGSVGYVSSAYLSSVQPDTETDPSTDVTGSKVQLFYENSNAVWVTLGSDGVWRDDDGLTYTFLGTNDDGQIWTNSEGTNVTSYDPWGTTSLSIFTDGEAIDLSRVTTGTEPNEYTTIYYQPNGVWKSTYGDTFTQLYTGNWVDTAGDEWEEA